MENPVQLPTYKSDFSEKVNNLNKLLIYKVSLVALSYHNMAVEEEFLGNN